MLCPWKRPHLEISVVFQVFSLYYENYSLTLEIQLSIENTDYMNLPVMSGFEVTNGIKKQVPEKVTFHSHFFEFV